VSSKRSGANGRCIHDKDNPCAVTQLSMGEGKTRVILPMLQLHLRGRANS
jgi:hypothetical protein